MAKLGTLSKILILNVSSSLVFSVLILFYTQHAHGEVNVESCPGLYCGRSQFTNGTYSQCGACERGHRPNAQSLCVKCHSPAELYDWLYLGFMAFLPLVLHCFFIDRTNKKKRAHTALHVSAFLECSLAAVITLVLFEPQGAFSLITCSVHRLSDWYSMLYNPTPHFKDTVHCTQEIVYPLYTIVMVYYGFSLLLMLLVRVFVSRQFTAGSGSRSIYSALYFIPILLALQAVFGGLIYYSFPYITLVVSAITNVIYLAYYRDQTVKGIVKEMVSSRGNLLVLLGHWFFYVYGIVAVTRSTAHLPLISLFPCPTLFYILTVHFSDPDHLHMIGRSR